MSFNRVAGYRMQVLRHIHVHALDYPLDRPLAVLQRTQDGGLTFEPVREVPGHHLVSSVELIEMSGIDARQFETLKSLKASDVGGHIAVRGGDDRRSLSQDE